MKLLFALILGTCLVFSSSVSVLAVDEVLTEEATVDTEEVEKTASDPDLTNSETVDETTSSEAPGDTVTEDATSEDSSDTEAFGEATSGESSADDSLSYLGATVYSMNPVTSADATGLKAVLLEFVGDYDAVVVEHAYENTNGYISYVREIQIDYPWLCSCGLLVIMTFCLFRLGGAILCRK